MSISITNTVSINEANDKFTVGSVLTATDGDTFTADAAKIEVFYFGTEESYNETPDEKYTLYIDSVSGNSISEDISVSIFNAAPDWDIYKDGVYNFKVTFYEGETAQSKTKGKFIDYSIRNVIKFNTLELGNDIDVPTAKYANFYKGEFLESALTAIGLNANVANVQNSLRILEFLQKITKHYNIE